MTNSTCRNLKIRLDKVINLFQWFVWMFNQYFEPRPIGTRITKVQNGFTITYEIIGYTSGRFSKELLEEVSKEEIIS